MIKLLQWCKTHLWQSILIGVAALGVIATSITLPIVLKDDESTKETPEEKKQEPKEEEHEDPPAPPTPVKTVYTINIGFFDTNQCVMNVFANGKECTTGTEVDLGTSITIIWESRNEATFDHLTISGADYFDVASPYVFTADDNVANEKVINFNYF